MYLGGEPRKHQRGVGKWDSEGKEATRRYVKRVGYHFGQPALNPTGVPWGIVKGMPQICSTQEAKTLLCVQPHLAIIGWGCFWGVNTLTLLASPVRGLNKHDVWAESNGLLQWEAICVNGNRESWVDKGGSTANLCYRTPAFLLVVTRKRLGFSPQQWPWQESRSKSKRKTQSDVICKYILCKTGFLKHLWYRNEEKLSACFLPSFLKFTCSVPFCPLILEDSRTVSLSISDEEHSFLNVLFLKHSKCVPSSGPLHLLSPLPGTLSCSWLVAPCPAVSASASSQWGLPWPPCVR